MPHTIHHIILTIMLLTTANMSAETSETMIFETLRTADGLSDNNLRYINALPDGRLVFTTEETVNIYDGVRFEKYQLISDHKSELRDYNGHTHVYLSSDTMLWIKKFRSLFILNLKNRKYISPEKYFEAKGISANVSDVFVDSEKNPWLLMENHFMQPGTGKEIILPDNCGEIQDIDAADGNTYLFDSNGAVYRYDADGKPAGHSTAYSRENVGRFNATSLVVKSGNSFYQLRNGTDGIFLKYDADTGQWHKIVETDYALNTLIMTADNTAYITCRSGFLIVEPGSGIINHLPYLRTRRGNVVATEISTVFQDAAGTLWLGTLNRGLLFSRPGHYYTMPVEGVSDMPHTTRHGSAGQFFEDREGRVYMRGSDGIRLLDFTNPDKCKAIAPPGGFGDTTPMGEYGSEAVFLATDGSLYFNDAASGCMVYRPNPGFTAARPYAPLLSEVHIHGEKINAGEKYHDRLLLPVAEPYVKSLTLAHGMNHITLKFSPMDFAPQEECVYRYMLEGFDRDWIEASQPALTYLTAQYTNIPPGKYRFRIMTCGGKLGSVISPETSLDIEVLSPWYRTTAAYICYILAAILAAWAASWLYISYQRRIMERSHREDILLVRIKSLIEQCDRYEAELKSTADDETSADENATDENAIEDNAFVAKAVRLVEENMNTPGYSVEQLSRDLCMERTGLYKKLVTLLNQSPSLFMRNVRLKHAATLLAAHEGSVAEIASRTGFSSASYFSKCFQEAYGCKPSEYAGRKAK